MVVTAQPFADSVTTAIRCEDNTCLCIFENRLVSLPTTRVAGNSTWKNQCMEDIKAACGLDIAPSSILRVHKIWMHGHSSPYIINITYLVLINPEQKKKTKSAAGKVISRLKWLSENDLQKFYLQDALSTPVILEVFPKLVPNKSILYPPETQVTQILTEVTESVLIEGKSNNSEITFDSSGLKNSQQALYMEFMATSYPGILMGFSGFCKFVTDLGVLKEDAPFLFQAADINNRRFLSYRDYMFVLAVLDPMTNHGGVSGEVRCRYIFRFFDRDHDGLINLEELKGMVIYMRKLKGLPVDAGSVEKEQKAFSASLNITANKAMSLPDFLHHAGELRIRGLSQVLRSMKVIKTQFSVNSTEESKSQLVNISKGPRINTTNAPYAKLGSHELAVHSVRIQKSGTLINLDDIWSLNEVCSNATLLVANITRESRRLSCDTIDQSLLCNDLLRNLRQLASLNKIKSGNRGNRIEHYIWGLIDRSKFSTKLMQLCDMLRIIFKSEPRLLDVQSPLYILGDFHGNFGDLQYFEKMFWPLGPGFSPCGMLFLGDYVDRGQFGMEVITYLFCYKMLYPHKIHLLRGNHEIRDVQKIFTFQSECWAKFGDKIGNELWECINSVFDVMPIAAVVDGKLFCAHGGIPPPWLCPTASAINCVPIILNKPDVQSSLAWEILWNDPIRDKHITPEVDEELKANDGFASNVKRGTAHVFNFSGLDRFLTVNGFSHVIRAHEMAVMGYNVSLRGKLITIFSTSKYIGQSNEAACVLVENGKLRVMRLDTTF